MNIIKDFSRTSVTCTSVAPNESVEYTVLTSACSLAHVYSEIICFFSYFGSPLVSHSRVCLFARTCVRNGRVLKRKRVDGSAGSSHVWMHSSEMEFSTVIWRAWCALYCIVQLCARACMHACMHACMQSLPKRHASFFQLNFQIYLKMADSLYF